MRSRFTRKTTLRPPDTISRLQDSIRRGELVAVLGTGTSIGLTNGSLPGLSWHGLVKDGFSYGVSKGMISATQEQTWKGQLESGDVDDLLGAAEFMGRKLGAPKADVYAHWMRAVFKHAGPTNRDLARALHGLSEALIPICTLNYDTLLEKVTGLPALDINETTKVVEWIRRERVAILHLHGVWESPESCILGIRDYDTQLRNEVRDFFQRALGVFRRLLFIGCGDTFADPNFSALIS
jgi:hypothetical protein